LKNGSIEELSSGGISSPRSVRATSCSLALFKRWINSCGAVLWLASADVAPSSCLGKVGAVCAREVSRFARNSRDWQQLIEMCRVVDTVLVDQETIYAPRHGNDRLLLGLKGSVNEYELDLLRQRSLSAR
jgi:hypothetical protein